MSALCSIYDACLPLSSSADVMRGLWSTPRGMASASFGPCSPTHHRYPAFPCSQLTALSRQRLLESSGKAPLGPGTCYRSLLRTDVVWRTALTLLALARAGPLRLMRWGCPEFRSVYAFLGSSLTCHQLSLGRLIRFPCRHSEPEAVQTVVGRFSHGV